MSIIARDSQLNGRATAVVGVDMLELVEEIREATLAYRRQQALVEQLEHSRKVILADLHERHRAAKRVNGLKTTETELENLARRDDEYVEFLKLQRNEKETLAELESVYYSLRNKLDVLQAQLAYYRSEMHFVKHA